MDPDSYGRYIDEGDGLPRWKLPPRSGHYGTRWKYMGEAIRELYPDHGARFVAERLGIPAKYVNILKYAARFGVKRTEARRRQAYGETASRLRRIYKMERARVMGGLPQVTKVYLGRGGVGTPKRLYALKHRYVKEYGYLYCEDDAMVLLYDGKTKRRLPGNVATSGFTEDDTTKKYGITFERAGDDAGNGRE